MMIGNIFQQFYNLIDSVVVGRFANGEALAAIGSTNSITFLFFALCNGIGVWGIWWSVGIVWFLSGFTARLRYLSFSRKAGL